jgi:hypothetical protein
MVNAPSGGTIPTLIWREYLTASLAPADAAAQRRNRQVNCATALLR